MNSSSTALRTALAAALVAISTFASCAGAPAAGQASSPAADPSRRITLELRPGPEYKFTSRWLIFPVTIYPQVACWLETPAGDYVATIYATAKGARGRWVSAPSKGRPEALPVWNAARGAARGGQSVDSVSGATSPGPTTRSAALDPTLRSGSYVVKLEVNRSYDYNASYTRENSGVSGQPSLIYEGRLELGESPSRVELQPMGRGSVDGSDGAIRPGLEGITSALQLLQGAEVVNEGGWK